MRTEVLLEMSPTFLNTAGLFEILQIRVFLTPCFKGISSMCVAAEECLVIAKNKHRHAMSKPTMLSDPSCINVYSLILHARSQRRETCLSKRFSV